METLRLKLLDDFACLAEACPDTCCKQWEIPVDEATWNAWNELPDEARRVLTLGVVTRPHPDGRRELGIRKNEDGFCVLLTEAGGCSVQQQYGHDMLPQTCRDYPRQELSYEGGRVLAATGSCPRVLQMFLEEAAQGKTPGQLFSRQEQPSAGAGENDDTFALQRLEDLLFLVMDQSQVALGLRVYYLIDVLEGLRGLETGDGLAAAGIRKHCKLNEKSLRKQLGSLTDKVQKQRLRPVPARSGESWQALFSGLWSKVAAELDDTLAGSPTFDLLAAGRARPDDEAGGQQRHFGSIGNRVHKTVQGLPGRYRDALASWLLARLVTSGFPLYSDLQKDLRVFQANFIQIAFAGLLVGCSHEGRATDDERFVEIVHRIDRRFGNSRVILGLVDKHPELFDFSACQQMALSFG